MRKNTDKQRDTFKTREREAVSKDNREDNI